MLSGCQPNGHNKCEESPSKQCQSKDQQPDAFNRASFSCSSPSSKMPSLSTTSSYSSDFSSSPRMTSSGSFWRCSSDEISGDSALLLYQAFVSGESLGGGIMHEQSNDGGTPQQKMASPTSRIPSIPEGVHRHQLDSDCDRSSESNLSSKQSIPSRRNERKSPERDDDHKDRPKDQLNSTSVRLRSDKDACNDEESYDSTTFSDQSQRCSNRITFTTSMSSHRKKIFATLISLGSLWLYSKYNQRSRRDRRHQLQHSGQYKPDLIQSKLLAIYKFLLQLLSRLRISKILSQLAKIKQTPSLPSSAAASKLSVDHATTTPLSHLLAVAKAGGISKVLLRGSVVSYLHSMQSSTESDSSKQRTNQRWSKTTLPSNNPNFLQEILSTLLNHGCDDITTLPESLWQRFLNGPALVIFPFAYLGALYWIMRRLQKQQLQDSGEGDNSFGWDKHGANRSNSSSQHTTTTFDDVAGIDSALQELSEVISYMRNPDTFHSVGASPPRGILLHGPPGSGKTLLARAIAGEAGRRTVGSIGSLGQGASIDCFAVCSGSDFVETYVGRGAARIRSLFRGVREEAWKNYVKRSRGRRRESVGGLPTNSGNASRSTMSHAWGSMQSLLTGTTSAVGEESHNYQRPMAIIFIDEIDALAKRRDSAGLSSSLGGCDEREQTLNQLLTEMDGFLSSSTYSQPSIGPSSVIVIVIAATNRIEVLDPAILRAGRFDRHVQVPLPDANGREAILRVHARRIRYDQSSVNFRELAAGKSTNSGTTCCVAPTHQFSGADLRNVVNEAALLAVRTGSPVVKQQHLVDAVHKVKCNIRSTPKEFQQIPPVHPWFPR